jgi:hypothetical protein
MPSHYPASLGEAGRKRRKKRKRRRGRRREGIKCNT